MEVSSKDYKKYFEWLKTSRVVQAYFNHRFKSDELTIVGSLNLSDNEYIKELVSVKSITGYLDLWNTPIKSLKNLESVGGYLDLDNTPIKSLGNLQSVGVFLNLENTPIESLGNLESVGYSLDLRDTPISKKMTESEIRKMVNVIGDLNI